VYRAEVAAIEAMGIERRGNPDAVLAHAVRAQRPSCHWAARRIGVQRGCVRNEFAVNLDANGQHIDDISRRGRNGFEKRFGSIRTAIPRVLTIPALARKRSEWFRRAELNQTCLWTVTDEVQPNRNRVGQIQPNS